MPENPGSNWDEVFPVDIQDDYTYRLGNYSLLEASINNKLDNNLSFSEKLEKYKTSSYKLSNEYCNYEKFTPKENCIEQRI